MPKSETRSSTGEIRAVLFDTFGTVVDWRTGITRAVEKFSAEHGVPLDAPALADAWRALYQPSMERIRSGERAYVPLDTLHRENLLAVFEHFDVDPGRFGAQEIDDLARSWHHLPPWPDSVAGIRSLRSKFIVGPLSNANTSLLINLAKYAGLNWDVVLGTDVTRAYKPDPTAYLGVVDLLGLRPQEVILVAAHNDDLRGARSVGLATAFVRRATEYGPNQLTDLEPTGAWDVNATDIEDVVGQLVPS